MTSLPPRRSLLKTTLNIGQMKIPIRLYKANDRIGLSGQLFHDGCNGKIRQYKTCEDHPDLAFPATFSGVQIADTIVRIDPITKRNLLFGDCLMDAVCVYPLKHFADLVANGTLIPSATYQLAPEDHFEDFLGTFLDRLRVAKSFLLVTFPEGTIRRYALVFPTGTLMSVLYEEEVRERIFEPTKPRSDLRRDFDHLISQYKTDRFPRLSAEDILVRLESWYSNLIVRINKQRRASRKKVPEGV